VYQDLHLILSIELLGNLRGDLVELFEVVLDMYLVDSPLHILKFLHSSCYLVVKQMFHKMNDVVRFVIE
jgi:hypothetical protein